MKKITLLLFFLLTLFQCAPPANQKKPPVAVKGVLDLRPSATLGNQGWDFEKGGIVSLDGEWEFYWEEFLDPTNVVGAEYIQPYTKKSIISPFQIPGMVIMFRLTVIFRKSLMGTDMLLIG